jgi:3,4-dihydroxy 2-butanone 4-phosphate synthase/GTP cyclohydrolase II
LISYRLQTEHLVTRLSSGEIVLDRTGTAWHAIVFEALLEQRQFLALVKGELDGARPTLCRMHAGSTLADVFSSTSGDGGKHLDEAIDAIEQEGSGVIVYLPPQGEIRDDLERLLRRNDSKSSPSGLAPGGASASRPHGGTLREYGLGAQVLRELGLCKIRLLTNNPRKIAGIQGYGLELVESVPLISMQRPA